MFEALRDYPSVVVTGPHRSGTTICAEMIGQDTGLTVYREEAFSNRDITKAEPLVESGGVFQGPYLLPWAPIFRDTMIVYVDRPHDEIAASLGRLRVSAPHFDAAQALRLWSRIQEQCEHAMTVQYHDLKAHPLWRDDRHGWHCRRTA